MFTGLWMVSADYAWDPHPVIRIDFSQFRIENSDMLKIKLEERIQEIAADYGVTCSIGDYQKQFRDLIRQLSNLGKVVVLIDEYDKPIIDNIEDVEVETCFSEHIGAFSTQSSIPVPELIEKIRHWYNGFCFSSACIPIHNPFSLLMVLDMQEFRNYWFETGTPTFLIRLIRKYEYDVAEMEKLKVNDMAFGSYEIERLSLLPILVQTGYLTIKGRNDTIKPFFI